MKHLFQRSGSSGKQRGSILMELGVCLPFAALILLGAIDFGRVWTLASATSSAARVGAQFGVQSPNHAADSYGIRQAALTALSSSAAVASSADDGGSTSIEDFDVTSGRYCECSDGSTIDCSNKCSGNISPAVFVRVQVDTIFHTLFDYRGIPNDVPIQRVAVLRAR
jgi:hypothetical protein